MLQFGSIGFWVDSAGLDPRHSHQKSSSIAARERYHHSTSLAGLLCKDHFRAMHDSKCSSNVAGILRQDGDQDSSVLARLLAEENCARH